MNNPDSNPSIELVKTDESPERSNVKVKSTLDINTDRFSKTASKNAKRMAKRVYVEESPIHGKGLFAAKHLKAGVTLGRLQGMITDEDGTYVLWLNKRIGFEITNEFRFINHDGDPNCALTDMEVITLRDIAVGEELTHDYGW